MFKTCLGWFICNQVCAKCVDATLSPVFVATCAEGTPRQELNALLIHIMYINILQKRFCSTEKSLKKSEPKAECESSNIQNMKDMPQASSQESKSVESLAGWRLSDTPAVVPIKKRRIQITEVRRSPSPPSKPSPSQSPHSAFPGKRPAVGTLLSTISRSPLLTPPSLPPSSPSPRSFASPPTRSEPLCQSVSPLRSLVHTDCVHRKDEAADFEDGELPDESHCLVGVSTTANDTIYHVSKSFSKQDKRQYMSGMNEVHGNREGTLSVEHSSPESSEGELPRSESGSLRQDDRSHWDLNTEMATWDEDSGKVPDYEATIKHLPMSISRNLDESSRESKSLGYTSDQDFREQAKEQSEGYANDDGDDEQQGLKVETLGIRSGEEESLNEEQEMRKKVTVKVVEYREEAMEEELEIVTETVEEETTIHEQEQVMDKAGGVIEQEMRDDEDEKQGVDEVEAMVQIIPRTEVEDHRYAGAISEGFLCQSAPLAQGPGGHPESHGGEELPLDGGDGLEDLSLVRSRDDDHMPESRLSRYDRQVKSFSDDGGEGWNRASEEPELEEHVDYGDSDFRDADEMGVDVDDRTQEESTWKEGEEDEMGHGGSQMPPSVEGEIDDEEEVGQVPTHDDGEILETSLEKRTRSRASGWDILPQGFDNVEEALRAAKEISSQRGGWSASWSSIRRGSLASSNSAGRFGPGLTCSTPRDGFSSDRTEYYGDRHLNEVVHDRDHFRPARRPDDDYSHSGGEGRDPGRRQGMFGRGRVGGWMDSQPGHMDDWGPLRHRPSSGFSGPPAVVDRENNGYLDGPGSKIGPGRGGMRSTISGGGSRGGRVHVGRGPPDDMDGAVDYPLRSDRVSNAGGRGFGTSGPGFGGMHERGVRGMMDRYRSGGMESRKSVSPRQPHPLDHPNMIGRVASMRLESRVVRSRTPPSSSHHRSMGHSQFSGRSQHSPRPSRWSSERRGADIYRDMGFRRPPSRPPVPSQRTSPHVVHGSSLMDERDRQVLAGSKHSPSLKSSINYAHIRSRDDDNLDSWRSNRIEGDDAKQVGAFSRNGEFRRSSPLRVDGRERERGEFYKRERDREDDRRRGPYTFSSREGRYTSGHKHGIAQETDDEVAPRRRRPS